MKRIFQKLFNSNSKVLKKYNKTVSQINSLNFKNKTDDELREVFSLIKSKINKENNENFLIEVYALIKEATRRSLKLETHDAQLIGALALNDGNIAEMKTGEGKTLVGAYPAIFNSLFQNVHIVTVNDYLADRDPKSLIDLYNFFNISVGVINSNTFFKQEEYNKDVVYASNHELVFDYLRDNMIHNKLERKQVSHDFVIIDEADSILIDEARNPLIISGESMVHKENFLEADKLARTLVLGEEIKNKQGDIEEVKGDFIVNIESQQVLLTDSGVEKAEAYHSIDNIYEEENVRMVHYLNQALTAHYSKKKDVHYIVRDGEVKVIDQNTGRISEGVRYSDGLHQAIEAKEGLEIKAESQSIASITYQNFFKIYTKMSGMTGTAETEASEFYFIYKLGVVSIPTHKPIARKDLNDLVYMTKKEKYNSIVKKVIELQEKGQPVLIGTASIEQSETLHKYLNVAKIEHEVLNAKNHLREAEIISKAGEKGSVTLATNMAGRGVDIKVPDECLALGGLYIIGSERHESRRIDNQLRGRSGRQGNPGISQFYLSLEDDIMVMFGGDKVKRIIKSLGMPEGESIDSPLVNKSITNSQKKIESINFEQRKHLKEYDDILNEQRKVIYETRNKILNDDKFLYSKMEELKERLTDKYILEYQVDIIENKDYSKIIDAIQADLSIKISEERINQLNTAQLKTELIAIISNAQEHRLGFATSIEENKINILRSKYLKNIDELWKEHIYQLDVLKSGIGLRSYNQKDPLTEYKKESYHMFLYMIETLKDNITISLFGRL